MNLRNKKDLVKRLFGVGVDRIIFVPSRVNDIKEAITKQDMRDLVADGAIIITPENGRRIIKRTKSRSQGNVRKRVYERKRTYILLTRKLRKHVAELRSNKKVTQEEFKALRKRIKNREFKSKANLKEIMGEKK